MGGNKRASCGLDIPCSTDIVADLKHARNEGYDFIAVPIIHFRFTRIFDKNLNDEQKPLTRSDLMLSSQVGKFSPFMNVDSFSKIMRRNAEKMFEQEAYYASHLSLPAIVLNLYNGNCVNLARLAYSTLLHGSNYQTGFLRMIWVQVPMISAEIQMTDFYDNLEISDDDPWVCLCHFDRRIFLVLKIPSLLPCKENIDRWFGEPIKSVFLPTNVFVANRHGFPVLPHSYQDILIRLFQQDVQVIIHGPPKNGTSIKHYQKYLDHLWQNRDQDNAIQQFAQGYEDYLQIPLQPLIDDLESQTYEIFEKDNTKYYLYQKAILNALTDLKPNSDERELIVMVVGAGRGPLVRCALEAALESGQRIRLYAVEKNYNAVVTLLAQKQEVWKDAVTVVSCDMREWNPPELADVLVSELLGSFGDNELSPECLDGAQKFLKIGGIIIPSKYTSYVAPIHSPRLYAEVSFSKDSFRPSYTCFEMPYVVHLQNRFELAKCQPLFTFHHPNYGINQDNNHYASLTFVSKQNAVLHGLAGYFDATLYKNIKISTVPETHTPDMFSWFPFLLPIKEPIPIKKNDQITIHIWRCVGKRSVWYEWCLTEPQFVPVHNSGGRSFSIGL